MNQMVYPDLVLFGEKARSSKEKDLVFRFQWLQRFFGFKVNDPPGEWGPETETSHKIATENYQRWLKENGFYDGEVDGRWTEGCATARSDAIRRLQEETKRAGFYKGDIDGVWNRKLERLSNNLGDVIREDLLSAGKPFRKSLAYTAPTLKMIPPAMPTWGKYLVAREARPSNSR